MTVLILGGTTEARALATAAIAAGLPVVSSLAGRVADPHLPDGPARIGGFGGPGGLAQYLREAAITAVLDATHPFAARITANAAQACAATGTPLLILHRPAWAPQNGDRWTVVPDLGAAAHAVADLVAPDARVLLTIGRQGVHAFAALPQRFWLRALEASGPPLPRHCELILARGPFTPADELGLLTRLGISLVVTKNSGGPMTTAKLTASRDLGLPVLMIDRPALPAVPRAESVAQALDWARARVLQRRPAR